MLVLTRKLQEIVVIGQADEIEPVLRITVLEIDNGKVRLGFEAAKNVRIHRWEVWERIRAAAESAGVAKTLLPPGEFVLNEKN